MGDGEQQEGQIWEAAMESSHHGLDNLVGIVHCNHLQIDGPVADVMNVEPLEEKYRGFGWDVRRVGGHDMGSAGGCVGKGEGASGQAARPAC
jgi:transketolase